MPTVIDGTTGASQIQNDTVVAAKIASGAVTEAKLASSAVTEAKLANGAVTADKLASGAITTTSVLAATAGATTGAVGTYAFCGNMTASAILPDGTVAGSNLRYTNAYLGNLASPVPSGTWKCMGYAYAAASGIYSASLFLRIS
jgi:hypothetical protein